MIDVFMLLRENILKLDPDGYSIPSVRFCEVDSEQYTEITDMLAVENAGTLGELEKVILFQEDDFTAQCPTLASIHMPILSIASLSILIGKPRPCLLPYFREVFFLPSAQPPIASRKASSAIARRRRCAAR
jgi:hypothetical protein